MSDASTTALIILMVAVYLLPTILGLTMKTPHTASVAVINVFLGWTLIGWVVALAMAVRNNDRVRQ